MRPTTLIAALVVLASGCSKKADKPENPVPAESTAARTAEQVADSIGNAGVPQAVADVGTHGENLYDQAKAADWAKAKITMDSLDLSAGKLSAEEVSQLAGVLDTLRAAIAAHHRETAIEASNRVTFIGAKLTERYNPRMPADIVRLDYYGRELEIWAARKDMNKLNTTAAELRRTWDAVKGTVISHGGGAAAAQTDSLVTRLGMAKSPADFARLATPILDVVDLLEKPFEK